MTSSYSNIHTHTWLCIYNFTSKNARHAAEGTIIAFISPLVVSEVTRIFQWPPPIGNVFGYVEYGKIRSFSFRIFRERFNCSWLVVIVESAWRHTWKDQRASNIIEGLLFCNCFCHFSSVIPTPFGAKK